jgi:hypothetical protein
MLHNSRATIGQGARRLCQVCGQPISIKPVGRTRRFCSDRCRDDARRTANFLDFGTTVPRRSGVTRNPIKLSTKSEACGAALAGRGSAVKAGSVVVAVGRGISTPNPAGAAGHPHRALVKRAIATEFAARWSRGGVRGS